MLSQGSDGDDLVRKSACPRGINATIFVESSAKFSRCIHKLGELDRRIKAGNAESDGREGTWLAECGDGAAQRN